MDQDSTSCRGVTAIEVDQLQFRFAEQLVFQDLSFAVQRKEFICILGPSGCGKSTLLRLIGGLLANQRGRIAVNGLAPDVAWRWISYVFQSPRLVPWRNAIDNVLLGAELRSARPDFQALRARASELLGILGLLQDATKYPAMLSGGERQRVAIARALIVDPEIILMDEPFSALDFKTRVRLRVELVSIWRRSGKTIVFVTHDVEEAVALADRIVVLSGKPSRVAHTIAIKHPRPRDLRGNDELVAIRRALEDQMHELEASASDQT